MRPGAIPALLHRGAYDTAQRLVARAQNSLADQPVNPEVLAARGAMHLRSAIIAARQHDAATAVARNATNPLPPGTMRSRVAHHHIDLGRAAIPMVAETVLTMAHAEQRRSDSLSGFAAWMGITA